MARKLLVIDGVDQAHFFLAVDGGQVTVGDSPTHAEAVLRGLHIARIRCEVEVDDDQVLVREVVGDGAAANGADRVLDGPLHLGHAHLRLETRDASPPAGVQAYSDAELPGLALEETPPPTPSATKPAATAPQPAGHLYKRLTVFDGADQGRFIYLPDKGVVTVGKSANYADLVLHDLYVSRVHCEIVVDGDDVTVRHVEGQNGTLINGQPIAGPHPLQLGDTLRVGNSHLKMETVVLEDKPADGEEEADDDAEVVEAVEEADDEEGLVVEVIDEEIELPLPSVDDLVHLEDQVLGHYKIGPLLGRGHVGVVFRAENQHNNQVVALKILAAEFPATGAELQKFVQALKVAPHLQHPNLVQLYGAGKTGAHCWMAREYVEGESLSRLLRRLQESKGFDWQRACRVAVHLARALAFLHQHKVVHGNLTPRNILVRGQDKRTKLADLMLVQALEGSQIQKAAAAVKRDAELGYLAPEQLEPDAFVDHLADLYCLGAVAYSLLTGKPPYGSDSVEAVRDRMKEGKLGKPSKHLSDLPKSFEAFVLKLLARQQEDRYQTAAEALAAVETIARKHELQV